MWQFIAVMWQFIAMVVGHLGRVIKAFIGVVVFLKIRNRYTAK
jgi:hypothetical protein